MPPERKICVELAGAPFLDGPAGMCLAAGARIADALACFGRATSDRSFELGIWGRKASPETLLRDGDRIEFYRPLVADPKTARRVRAKP